MRVMRRKGGGMVHIPLILVTLIMLVPLLSIVVVSVSSWTSLTKSFFSFTYDLHLENYASAWEKGNMSLYFSNTIVVLMIALILINLCASLCAFSIKLYKTKTVNLIYYMLLAGIFVPIQAVMLPLLQTMKVAGLLNTRFGVALVYVGMNLPLALMLFCGFYQSIPGELLEASMLDGCNSIRTYFHVIFPLSGTIISTVIILSGLQIWRDFFVPLILAGTPNTKTIAISLMQFVGFYNYDWTGICAAMVIQTLPILLLFLLLQKYFVNGIVAGAVKG